jgi:D-glucosaminate-6-phosphate ammonia-lyase
MNDAPAGLYPADRSAADPYTALGVRPFINCCSVRTVHGGSLMLPEVREAVAAASHYFVNLDELMQAAGERLAALTGAEWGLVTCGSAAAVALATAACVAGNDPTRMLRLPFTEGWTNRVVMLRNQRFAYDQAIRMIGTHIVEVDTLAEFEAALLEPVAMVAVLGTHEAQSAFRIEDIVARTRPLGIPVMVDAASEHLESPSPWLVRGADLVVYSGGKFLRGPQTSGLLLGRKDLVQAAWHNAAPHQALGRPMKVSKEDVIGLLTAVEIWFKRDLAAEQARWRGDVTEIARILAGVPDVSCQIVEPAGVVRVPTLRVTWNAARAGLDGESLRQRLLSGSPRIMLDDMSADADSVTIDPFGLQPGEATQVGHGVAGALSGNRGFESASPKPAAADLTGEWKLSLNFLHGARHHLVHLRQSGDALAGEQESDLFRSAVDGAIAGDVVRLRMRDRYESTNITFQLSGVVSDGAMSGTMVLGTSNDHNQGAVNLAQFGGGSWMATRLG